MFEALRRRLLSCTSIVRGGAAGLSTTFLAVSTAHGREHNLIENAVEVLTELNRQEFAALSMTTAVAVFSVVAAIQLMRTRLRAAEVETQLRDDNQALQNEADRFRALLFTEPQVLISWAAGDDRPDISGDVSLVLPHGAEKFAPQRVLAFGTWLHPEQALAMSRAVDALRNTGESFLLNLTTSFGRTVEVIGRATGGQAIVRIRESSGLRLELAELNIRYKQLSEETSILRAFTDAIPMPIWAKHSNGTLSYVNAAYAQATDAASVTDALKRNLELLDSDDRSAMDRTLADKNAFTARLPVVSSGQRRIFDIQALNLPEGSVGIAIDASETSALNAALTRMAEAHRRLLDQLSSGVAVFNAERRLAFDNDPIAGFGIWIAPSSIPAGRFRVYSTSCVLSEKSPSSKTSARGKTGCTKPIALSRRTRIPGICRMAARSASLPRQIPKAASLIFSTMSPRA